MFNNLVKNFSRTAKKQNSNLSSTFTKASAKTLPATSNATFATSSSK